MSARFFWKKGGTAVPRPFWVGDFLLGVSMKIALFLMIIGAILVYGANFIVSIFRVRNDYKNILLIKTIGLTVAVTGILKIFEII